MPNQNICAEVIAIGDELTSGQRLDTNSQWISQKLNELGIAVAYHTTVGDSFRDSVRVLRSAARRCDLIACTGGLGPTDDDLTRQVLARVAGQPLQLDRQSLAHIRQLFRRRQRTMQENNRRQARLPQTAQAIPNPHGTAPGIQLVVSHGSQDTLILALPGVPAELMEMWSQSVAPLLKSRFDSGGQIFHRVIHTFGQGESEIAARLPQIIARYREPLVGITASKATISLRIQAHAKDPATFETLIEPTVAEIRTELGDLVFGCDDQTLQSVLIEELQRRQKQLVVIDVGHHNLVGHLLSQAGAATGSLLQATSISSAAAAKKLAGLESVAGKLAETLALDSATRQPQAIHVAYEVAPSPNSDHGNFQVHLAMVADGHLHTDELAAGSHASIRELRIAKWVMNRLRLWLNHSWKPQRKPQL